MKVAELIAALSSMPLELPVLIEWEGTLNAVEVLTIDESVRIVERTTSGQRITVGAVVIDGENRVDIAR